MYISMIYVCYNYAMNVGKLRNENQQFVDSYLEKGFSTRTELIDAAVLELRKAFKAKERAEWREKAFAEYRETQPSNVFEDIQGDGFA